VKAPVQATINLGPLGKVDVQPNTDFEINFTGSSVTITLHYGTVTLTTQSGVTGEVVAPTCTGVRVQVASGNVSVKTDAKTDTLGSGKSERVNNPDVTSSGPSSFTLAAPGTCGGAPTNAPGGSAGSQAPSGGTGGSRLPTGLTIAIIGGSVAAAIILGVTLGGRPDQRFSGISSTYI